MLCVGKECGMNVNIEPLDVNNWLKDCELSISEEQKSIFPISNVYWICISRYEEKNLDKFCCAIAFDKCLFFIIPCIFKVSVTIRQGLVFTIAVVA